jgi:hypothetical protein
VSNGAKDEEEGEKGKHERQMINDRRVHLKNREDALRNAASMNKQREIHPLNFFLFETKIQKMFSFFSRCCGQKKTRRRWRWATDKNFLL